MEKKPSAPRAGPWKEKSRKVEVHSEKKKAGTLRRELSALSAKSLVRRENKRAEKKKEALVGGGGEAPSQGEMVETRRGKDKERSSSF